MSTPGTPTPNASSPPLRQALREVAALLPAIEALSPTLETVARELMAAFERGNKLLTCGNGGSAADAVHLAEELAIRFEKNRRALPALALLEPASLTACANDFGYDTVFSRQVEALGKPGDLLVVFTTSGNSPNILRAVDTAHRLGLTTVAFLGRDGGKLRGVCTHELLVPAPTSHRVQEGHLILYHTLCQWVDTQVS